MDTVRLFNVIDNPILELFMSQCNVDLIHAAVIHRVKQVTGITISKQSEHDVFGIMSNVYHERGNTTCYSSIHDEVRKLNGYVINEVVDNVKSGILMHLQYLKDASTLPVPLARSTATTRDKSLSLASTML